MEPIKADLDIAPMLLFPSRFGTDHTLCSMRWVSEAFPYSYARLLEADHFPSQQILWTHAQSIARTYPSSLRDRYVAAAATLRVPYWDWAATPALPEVVTTPLITINTPDGMKNMDNPLFNYTFQSDAAGNGFPAGHPVSQS